MKYAYHDLYDRQFEKLVVLLCSEILGQGVQQFSTGKDGGRDARFIGTANSYPSESNPYSGQFIVQAKHTEHPFSKVSEQVFSGSTQSSIVSQEIKKIKKLKEKNEINHYLLFTNRRCPADATIDIEKRIKTETGINSAEIIGIEKLETLLKLLPKIPLMFDLQPIEAPLRVSPDEIADVITELSKQDFNSKIKAMTNTIHTIQREKFQDKNSKNRLSNEYANLIKKSIKDFSFFKDFLEDPQNDEYNRLYISASDEFQSAVVSHKDDFLTYDRVLDYLFQLLVTRDADLSKNRCLTRKILYYMYWNCDLGSN